MMKQPPAATELEPFDVTVAMTDSATGEILHTIDWKVYLTIVTSYYYYYYYNVYSYARYKYRFTKMIWVVYFVVINIYRVIQ